MEISADCVRTCNENRRKKHLLLNQFSKFIGLIGIMNSLFTMCCMQFIRTTDDNEFGFQLVKWKDSTFKSDFTFVTCGFFNESNSKDLIQFQCNKTIVCYTENVIEF